MSDRYSRLLSEEEGEKHQLTQQPQTNKILLQFPENQNPSPPPKPDRNTRNYDTNHWSRLLNNAAHLVPGVRRYLVAMYNAGVGLKQKNNKRDKNYQLLFVPGTGPGWDQDPGGTLKEIMTTLYTYMVTLPATEEESPALPALDKAIQAGGRIVPCAPGERGIGGFRFDWSRAEDNEEGRSKVAEARAALDEVRQEVAKYLRRAGEDARKLGFVIGLTAFAEVGDGDFNERDWCVLGSEDNVN